MKKTVFISVLLIALSSLLVQCKKDSLGLNGSASVANFTYQIIPLQDTLPFAYKVTFTNVSEEALQYQWDFGDNTAFSSQKNPVHQYAVGGEYTVKLTSVGTNGNNTVAKRIYVIDACQNDFFNKLTGCNNNVWTWSTDADAIKVLSPDGTQVFFSGPAANCQKDDLYKFYADGKFEYDANGQTFDAQAGFSCQAPKANGQKYKVVGIAGQLPQIILDNVVAGGTNPFIGTTDVVDNNNYEIASYSEEKMTLRGRLAGTGGQRLEVKLKKVVSLTLADIKALLNGGSSKGWKLDATPGANAITVGTEADPTQYFAGGPLDAGCQTDDVYTFTTADKVSYNANGSTFNGGNITPNYNCGSDRSYTDIAYTFGATTGGVAGLATLQLPSAPPNIFIGTTDVPAENVYRIIEISANKMLLRAGNGTSTVFQFKFIPQ
jgi:PKD repeat protein